MEARFVSSSFSQCPGFPSNNTRIWLWRLHNYDFKPRKSEKWLMSWKEWATDLVECESGLDSEQRSWVKKMHNVNELTNPQLSMVARAQFSMAKDKQQIHKDRTSRTNWWQIRIETILWCLFACSAFAKIAENILAPPTTLCAQPVRLTVWTSIGLQYIQNWLTTTFNASRMNSAVANAQPLLHFILQRRNQILASFDCITWANKQPHQITFVDRTSSLKCCLDDRANTLPVEKNTLGKLLAVLQPSISITQSHHNFSTHVLFDLFWANNLVMQTDFLFFSDLRAAKSTFKKEGRKKRLRVDSLSNANYRVVHV